MKKQLILITIILFSLVPSSYAANDFAYNRLYEGTQPIDGLNYSINVNNSDNWVTNIGTLSGVQAGQFNNIGGLLTIDSNYIDANWCALTGCTMEGDINMGGNNILDVSNIAATEFINITTDLAGGEESQINVFNTNDFGYSGTRWVNSVGDEFFAGIFGRNISAMAFPNIVDGNESLSGMASVGGPIFIATTNNESIYLGGGPSATLLDTDFFLRIDPVLKSLEIQGNKFIRPVTTDGVQTMIFESNIGAAAGELTFGFIASDSDNNSVAQSIFQIGKNHSGSIQGMNSQIVASKDFLTMPANVKAQFENNTGDPIIEEWFSNITSCLVYEEYLQGLSGFNFLSRGLSTVCDTVSQGVPTSILGYIESVGLLTAHGGATIFDNLNYIGSDGNDVDFRFNGGLENGKFHIQDNRQILANITFFDFLIAGFDAGTISPFVSETIGTEPGRDWRATLISPDECFNDNCATARGGVDKIMAFSSSTTFEGGTVGSNNSRLLFYVTTSFSGNANISVTLDDNQGNVSLIYSETTTVSDDFINVSFPPEFESKANVTTRFTLDAVGGTNQVWIDEVRVNSEPNETIEINETYKGGKITLGDDSNPNTECYIEKDKFIPNGSTSTEDRMNLVCDNINFVGNASFVDVTHLNINVTENIESGGNITAEDNLCLGNGACIGWNTTCAYIFYNETGSVVSTLGCV